jgi:hypothetical protein
MIIGLNGRMQSGKDTTAQILMGLFENVERVSFAEKLKASASASIGITRDQLEALKLRGEIRVVLFNEDGTEEIIKTISGRQYLQYRGTEGGRDIFGEDIWVESALDTPVTDGTILVVTDMRFPNEIAGVLERGGIAVKIRREEADSKPILHPSEQTLPDDQFDYFLDNNGSLNDLFVNVIDMVDWIKANRPQYRFVDNPMAQVTIV